MPKVKTTEELLAQRAEHDARRWERAAVEMERQRNEENERRVAADKQVVAMRAQVIEQALAMIAALDTIADQIAAEFNIPLARRGCEHDEC